MPVDRAVGFDARALWAVGPIVVGPIDVDIVVATLSVERRAGAEGSRAGDGDSAVCIVVTHLPVRSTGKIYIYMYIP